MTILSIQHLNFGFRGRTLFKDAQMTIPLPGIFGLAAPAGSGKTTLFNLISGLLPSTGVIRLFDTPITPAVVSQNVAYVPNTDNAAGMLRGSDYVALIAAAQRITRQRQTAVLHTLGVDDFARQRLSRYTPGMRQRLQMALVLLLDRPLNLLDEPLDDVDPASLTTICDAISQLGRAGKTVIVSTSQPDRLVTVTNTMFVFAEQQILEVPSGGTDDLTSASDQRFFK